MNGSTQRRPAPGPPRAFFTLSILYLFAFFLIYCMVLMMPALMEVARMPVPGPEQQRLAEQAGREALQGKVLPAAIAAVATLALGIYAKILPGFRTPR